jgi:hypothetical protein
MGKIIDCHKVNPTSDCQHVVRGANEEEVLRNAADTRVACSGEVVHPGRIASTRPTPSAGTPRASRPPSALVAR